MQQRAILRIVPQLLSDILRLLVDLSNRSVQKDTLLILLVQLNVRRVCLEVMHQKLVLLHAPLQSQGDIQMMVLIAIHAHLEHFQWEEIPYALLVRLVNIHSKEVLNALLLPRAIIQLQIKAIRLSVQ